LKMHRILAIVLRYLYVYRRSWVRQFEMVFWPTMDLLVWGYVTIFIQRTAGGELPNFITFLIGAMIFWDILYRCQQGISISFLEDVWARNLLNVFCSPLRLSEYITATYIFGLMRVGATFILMSSVALVLYRFDVFDMGLYLLPFMANLLVFGLTMGLFAVSVMLRFGQGAEALVWALPFLIQPVSAVFYPIEVLPSALKNIALLLPTSYVFEGMRAVIRNGAIPSGELILASGLNLLYLVLSAWLLSRMFDFARDKGTLGKLGME